MNGIDIKNYRLKNKIKQQDFAKTIGISRQRLSFYENGGNIPPLNVKLINMIIKEHIEVPEPIPKAQETSQRTPEDVYDKIIKRMAEDINRNSQDVLDLILSVDGLLRDKKNRDIINNKNKRSG